MKRRACLVRRAPALVVALGVVPAAHAALVEPFWIDVTRPEVECRECATGAQPGFWGCIGAAAQRPSASAASE